MIRLFGVLSLRLWLLMVAGFMAGCENTAVSTKAIDSDNGYSDIAGINFAVGKPAPTFTIPGADGNKISLADYRGKKNVMLLFYRGYWCPFCIGHLDDIQSLFPKLADFNVQLLALSPDDAENSQNLAKRFDQPYLFLSDPDLAVTDLYGVRKDEDLPHPAVVLIDKAGVVQWFYVGEDYKKRPSAKQLETVMQRVFK
ncbi:peroxiredoxin [Oceanicoccus sp. KOV_DT_Chl]|uniref:peroxiredoxin family protein n=1 Tax=Oceanicoccus sp. KOV_DT_Chl TaxID=1904639 RepID=UPI000C7CF7DB|nr:peroxiredoxin family protein [Oceanicoccus sp. KOV_DT_Chl]